MVVTRGAGHVGISSARCFYHCARASGGYCGWLLEDDLGTKLCFDCHAVIPRGGWGGEQSQLAFSEKVNILLSLKEMCHQYWPASGTSRYDQYTVQLSKEIKTGEYVMRKLKLNKVINLSCLCT